MARRTVSFDGTSLQSSTIKTQDFEHESMDNRDVLIERLGNRDGGKLVSDIFAPRIIRLAGIITGTTIDDLENNIDNLKELLNRKEKNLDIQYSSGTRRYKASCTSFRIARKHFNITFAPFEATFVVANPPFGTLLDSTTVGFAGVGTNFGTFNGNFTASGTRRPMPVIKMTVKGQSNMTKATFTNTTTGGSISVTRTYADNDVLVVDTDNYTVTVNDVAVDYDGVFPEFAQGGNNFKRIIASTWHSVELKLIYRPLYL